MKIVRRTWVCAYLLFFLSFSLFLYNAQYPSTPNFDEFHYVPSAKQFLELRENQNYEHPPLGKLLMATGIGLFGDQPIGWRIMSILFGSLTLVGMYFLALVLFHSEVTALWVALITVCNHLLYVQARIGMLDTFMFGFQIWAMVFFCATFLPSATGPQQRKMLLLSGLFFGLTTACKWFGAVPWLACLLLVLAVRTMQGWGVTFSKPKSTDWYRPHLWKALKWKDWLLNLGLVPIVTYFLTFIPYLFVHGDYSFKDIFFSMQYKMWDGQMRVVSAHPYMSQWTDWAILRRPIWYAFDREDQGFVRGVVLLGNPLMMWGGLVAIVACAWDWVKQRDTTAFLIFFFYSAFYFCWVVIPRKISFYYYYYPAGMMLSFALAYVFHAQTKHNPKQLAWTRWVFLGTSFILFAYFFPILAALKIPSESFRKWMWFQIWI